jgi:hypothetical protein
VVRGILSIWVGVAIAAAVAGPAIAEGYRAHKSGQYAREAPVRDCTRINGKYGYYGNPWCTHQEQARWDRWEASRRVR